MEATSSREGCICACVVLLGKLLERSGTGLTIRDGDWMRAEQNEQKFQRIFRSLNAFPNDLRHGQHRKRACGTLTRDSDVIFQSPPKNGSKLGAE